jgi:DNA-binding GntR family transcriptional regulator
MTYKVQAAKAESRASTQASSVYDRLQQDILAGRLEPGRRLRLKELIELYEVGNSPLREALNRLASDGMVTLEENRGFLVPLTSIEELEELLQTRCWLEEIALRDSIENGDADWQERIVLAYHWLSQASRSSASVDENSAAEWEEHHMEFHRALISGCRSSILVGYCAQLQNLTLRYRNLAEVIEYRDLHELEEHQKLQDAVLQRDTELAVGLLHKHYTVTMEILLASGRFD